MHEEEAHAQVRGKTEAMSILSDIYLIWQTNNYCPCCGNKLLIKTREGGLKRSCDEIIRQRREQASPATIK